MNIDKIKTLGELKKSGYKHRSVKEEVRENLLSKLQKKENSFPGIVGYEDSVIRIRKVHCFPDIIFYFLDCAARQKHVWPGR